MFIAGEWVGSESGEVFDVIDPATEEVIAQVTMSSEVDVTRAVAAARGAFAEWRWVPGLERAELLQEAAGKLRANFEAVVQTLTAEEGKAISENEEEVEWVIGTLEYYAGLARTYRGRLLAPAERSQFNFVMKEPLGVVGCIVPFNYPLVLMIWKVAPALAAGNTVVV
jgi:acyl-CoA reductase-like NAD-dependent aldehyde dehydrogenase